MSAADSGRRWVSGVGAGRSAGGAESASARGGPAGRRPPVGPGFRGGPRAGGWRRTRRTALDGLRRAGPGRPGWSADAAGDGRADRGDGVAAAAAQGRRGPSGGRRIAAEQGWPAPSYPVVRRIIAGLDRGLLAMAHDGPDEYRDEFELVLRRESAHPNDMWQADHTELDVMVLDETGQPARPWLTVILDDHSRAVAGYTVFLGDPTALQTALALRQAIWRKTDPAWPVCGVPAVAVQRPRRRLHQHPHRPGVRRPEGAADPQHTRDNPAAGGRSNGCSARSPPSCCPPCPGTSRPATTADRSPRRP